MRARAHAEHQRARRDGTGAVSIATRLIGYTCLFVAASCSQDKIEKVNFPLDVRHERDLDAHDPLALAWSPNSTQLAAATDADDTITVWDAAGRELAHFSTGMPRAGQSIAFAPDDLHILFWPPDGMSDDVALVVRELPSGRVVHIVEGPDPGGGYDANHPDSFSVTPERGLVAMNAVGGRQHQINLAIADTKAWTFDRKYSIEHGVTLMSFFSNGQRLATGGELLRIHSTPSYAPPSQQFQVSGGGMALAGSPDGHFVFIDHSQTLATPSGAVLRAADGMQVAAFPLPANALVDQAEWDPKGRYVAFLDQNNELVLWRPFDARASYEKIIFSGHSPNCIWQFANSLGGLLAGPAGIIAGCRPAVRQIALSPDGARIAVATSNGIFVYSIE
jgi:WD40 repeat protein